MSIFDRLKKGKKKELWDAAYEANPYFYEGEDVQPFGVFTLTEDTDTILSKDPRSEYNVEGERLETWKLIFVSITKDEVIGEMEYYEAIQLLKNYAADENRESILVRGLTLQEMESFPLMPAQ